MIDPATLTDQELLLCVKEWYQRSGENPEMPIENFLAGLKNFSHGRIRNLKWRGIRTLGDLCRSSRKDLLLVKNLGEKCIQKIESRLKLYGLELA